MTILDDLEKFARRADDDPFGSWNGKLDYLCNETNEVEYQLRLNAAASALIRVARAAKDFIDPMRGNFSGRHAALSAALAKLEALK